MWSAYKGFALSVLMAVAHPAFADLYYLLDLEGAQLTGPELHEGRKRYDLTLQGGARTPMIRRDPQSRSQVLVLTTAPTPAGVLKDRAEVRLYSGVTFDHDWFVGLDVMIPRGTLWPRDWQILLQCHQNNTALPPPISLDLEPDGQLSLVARGDADRFEQLWSGSVPQGRWVRLGLSFRLGDDGFATLWVDGRKVADHRGSLGWSAGARACGIKAGIYRGASPQPFELMIDNLQLGDSRADAQWR